MADLPVLVTPKEAARLLRLSKSTLHQLLASGRISSVKIGRSRRIPLTELSSYVTLLLLASASADVGDSGR